MPKWTEVVPHSQPTAPQQTVLKIHMDPQYNIFHWGFTILGASTLWQTFSALLALCVGNSPVICEFPSQRPVTCGFDVFFYLRLNKRLSKQSRRWWFETPSHSLWRHWNVLLRGKTTTIIYSSRWASYWMPLNSTVLNFFRLFDSSRLMIASYDLHLYSMRLNYCMDNFIIHGGIPRFDDIVTTVWLFGCNEIHKKDLNQNNDWAIW